MVDQLFVLALALIAAKVAVGLAQKKNMWKSIITYWLVLTAKNLACLILSMKG